MVHTKACVLFCVLLLAEPSTRSSSHVNAQETSNLTNATSATTFPVPTTVTVPKSPVVRSLIRVTRQAQAVSPNSEMNAKIGAAIGANLLSKVVKDVQPTALSDPSIAQAGAALFGDIGAGAGAGIGVGVGGAVANKIVDSSNPNNGFIKRTIASVGQSAAKGVGAGVGAGIGGGIGAGIANKLIPGGSADTVGTNVKDVTARGAAAGLVATGTNAGLVTKIGLKIGSSVGTTANKKIATAIATAGTSNIAPTAQASRGLPLNPGTQGTLSQGVVPLDIVQNGVSSGSVAGNRAEFSGISAGGRADVVAGVTPVGGINGQVA